MITNALLTLFSNLLNVLLSTRPAWDYHLGYTTAQAIVWFYGLDNILPVTEIFQCAFLSTTLFFALSGFKWTTKALDWIADIIP